MQFKNISKNKKYNYHLINIKEPTTILTLLIKLTRPINQILLKIIYELKLSYNKIDDNK